MTRAGERAHHRQSYTMSGIVLDRVPERVLGRYTSGEPGPLLIVTAGVHGNEPAGVLALGRVMKRLQELAPRMRGELVAFAGNRAALGRGVRFVDDDFNRIWSAESVRAMRSTPHERRNSEQREQAELLDALEGEIARPHARVILLDLHSTSAGGPPFSLMGDTLQNRKIAFALGVPVLLGLEENIDGTLLEYFGERGFTSLVLEGGQNQDPATVDHHESAVWLVLVAAGLLERAQVPDCDAHRARLHGAGARLPKVVEVLHRHGLEEGEAFRMLPGLANFQTVARGRLLAHSGARAERQVTAPFSGVLLMPRYQGQGLDGFFLGRRVNPLWLELSSALRRMRLERWLGLLPGVSLRERRGKVIEVDARIARCFSVELFHLLGYRKRVAAGVRTVFSRRVEGE
jgi:succinylglutamate desuccinylase